MNMQVSTRAIQVPIVHMAAANAPTTNNAMAQQPAIVRVQASISLNPM
jgi:hypothetical protein